MLIYIYNMLTISYLPRVLNYHSVQEVQQIGLIQDYIVIYMYRVQACAISGIGHTTQLHPRGDKNMIQGYVIMS